MIQNCFMDEITHKIYEKASLHLVLGEKVLLNLKLHHRETHA